MYVYAYIVHRYVFIYINMYLYIYIYVLICIRTRACPCALPSIYPPFFLQTWNISFRNSQVHGGKLDFVCIEVPVPCLPQLQNRTGRAARRLLTTKPRWPHCTAINIFIVSAGHCFVVVRCWKWFQWGGGFLGGGGWHVEATPKASALFPSRGRIFFLCIGRGGGGVGADLAKAVII